MTLICQTGINEGSVYNATGSNLTEWPTGQPNRMVGGYYYDFAGLTGTGPLYTNEVSVIISDGRKMRPRDDNTLALLDTYDADENTEELGSAHNTPGIDRVGFTTTVTHITARFRLGNPTYQDVYVLNTVMRPEGQADQDYGLTNSILDTVQEEPTLASWLDDAHEDWTEGTFDAQRWWTYRAYLRYSIHWAIYKIPLTTQNAEGTSDDAYQADMGPGGGWSTSTAEEPHEPTPEIGPAGLMTALGGGGDPAATTNAWEWPEGEWVRLWEPGPKWYKPIAYGDIGNLAYGMGQNTNESDMVSEDPAAAIESDIIAETVGPGGYRIDAPDVRANGREVSLTIRTTKDIHVGPDEMLVLHIQTGRARLQAPVFIEGTLFDNVTPGLIIGRGYPAMGPKFTLHYMQVNARAKHKPLANQQ